MYQGCDEPCQIVTSVVAQSHSPQVKVRKNGQQTERATSFATLLQNELNSDVARFSTHV